MCLAPVVVLAARFSERKQRIVIHWRLAVAKDFRDLASPAQPPALPPPWLQEIRSPILYGGLTRI
jgi:hypothetical protein